jgi:hypothetical protein
MGTSAISFRGDGESTAELLGGALARLQPGNWQVEAVDLLPVRRSVDEVATRLLRTRQPDVAILGISAQPIAYESVLVRIQRRWPWALATARAVDGALRRAARDTTSQTSGARGLVYRVPRAAALSVLGGETAVSLDHAIENTERCISALARDETAPVIVRLPVGGARATPARRRRQESTLHAYSSAIIDTCRRHHISYVDVKARLSEAGGPSHASDSVHLNHATRRLEAALLAQAVIDLYQDRAS